MLNDPINWASDVFGTANLGDDRRVTRLIKLTSDLASSIGDSVVKASQGPGSCEGAYRFIRNEYVCAKKTVEADFLYTYKKVKNTRLVLAVQDTTALTYKYSVCNELGNASCANLNKKSNAWSWQSTLLGS